MAYETGTASGHIDLLDKLRTFLTTNAELVAAGQEWTQLVWQEVPAVAGQYELILKGPGLADDDEIYVGIQTYESIPGDYYNWTLNGYTGYDAGLTFTTQPGAFITTWPRVYLTNGSIKYWFVANGRRFVVVAKVSTVYEMCYMGLILPYLPNNLLPYPLLVAGCGINRELRWSDTSNGHNHGIMYPMSPEASDAAALLSATSCTRIYDGGWKGLQAYYGSSYSAATGRNLWPYCSQSISTIGVLGTNLDGTYTLFPIIPHQKSPTGETYGELDGCYQVSGYNNAVENIVTVDGYDHLVVQNVYRTTRSSYWALRLGPTAAP